MIQKGVRQRIIIRDIEKPREDKADDDLKWICDSLGFASGRDIEETSLKIMAELLGQFREKDVVATEEIAKSLKIEAPTINHHLRNLMETGIIIREKRKVALRGRSFSDAIEEMRRDSDRMFERILEVAKRIDEEF